MNRGTWRQRSLCILILVALSACVAHQGTSVSLPSSAFFPADEKEQALLQQLKLSHRQALLACTATAACEDELYASALVALFENRADAVNAFQELYTTTPEGQHAASAQAWLSLLQDSHPASFRRSAQFLKLKQEVVRSLSGRDILTASQGLAEYERGTAEAH
jgi:hypothetical protein